MSVVVLGSINADLVLRTARLPTPGETVRAHSYQTHPGGKGANQAVAAARLGAAVALIGRVGDDAQGASVSAALRAAGVDISGVMVDTGAPTGAALITVADDGTNTIVTSGGANHAVGERELGVLSSLLPAARVLLLQLEVPIEVAAAAAEIASAAGVTVVLDPAPVRPLPEALWASIGWITPNESEALALTGIAPDTEEHARAAAGALVARGVPDVVVTLGSRGCVHAAASGVVAYPAAAVDAVDTVACGDAFNGALAAAIVAGTAREDAIRYACAAGAAAATVGGAYPSLPAPADVEALLGRSGTARG